MKIFNEWASAHFEHLISQVYPLYQEQYAEHGPGYIVCQFPSMEALREKQEAGITFVKMKGFPIDELLVKYQGDGWLPLMCLILDSGAVSGHVISREVLGK